ncbi:MAG: hypothetical protein K0M50_20565 [Prolixibacteraceae bacterium]|nr:hypothetical protein [Prolixibacteraceae bacterium]
MRTVFLDTNIFLHYKQFDQIDWLSVCSASECELVITPIVIDELDKHKIGNTKIGKRARNVLTQIEKLYETGNFEIQKDVSIKIINEKPKLDTYSRNGLNYQEQDHRIFACIIEYRENNPSCEISLLTVDVGPRIRARQFDINVIKPPEKYFISPGETDEEKTIKKLEQENVFLKSRIPSLTLEFEDGKEFYKIKKGEQSFEREKFVTENLGNKKVELEHLVYKENAYENPMAAFLQTMSVLSLSPEQIDKYNSELDNYFEDYKKYLIKKFEFIENRKLSHNISIYLSNSGSIPAENVDIHLHFPDGFKLIELEDYPKPPKEPKPPYKPKSRFDFEGMGLSMHLPNLYPTFPSDSKIEINKPTIRKTNSYEVDFQRNYLKHHYKSKLDTLVMIYERFENKQNFKIEYVISAANMPDIIQGNLNIIYE